MSPAASRPSGNFRGTAPDNAELSRPEIRNPNDDAPRHPRSELLVAPADHAHGSEHRRVRGDIVGRRSRIYESAGRGDAGPQGSSLQHRELGGFIIRLKRGTYCAHIVEHVALELQTMIGHDVGYGRTRGGDGAGEYTLIFEHLNEAVGLRA